MASRILPLMMHEDFRTATGATPAMHAVPSRLARDGRGRILHALRDALGWLSERTEKRRQRRALSKLDGRLLLDIGVSRAEAAREAKKLF